MSQLEGEPDFSDSAVELFNWITTSGELYASRKSALLDDQFLSVHGQLLAYHNLVWSAVRSYKAAIAGAERPAVFSVNDLLECALMLRRDDQRIAEENRANGDGYSL